MLPWLIVGNPENRRVTGFVEALQAAGRPLRGVVAWRDVLADPGALRRYPDEPLWLRLESAGEDDALTHGLLVRGGGDPATTIAFGQLVAPRAIHEGFLSVLGDVGAVLAERPQWRPLAPLPSIVRAFDKVAFLAHATALGVRTAPVLPDIGSYDALAAAMEAGGVTGRVFVKLRYGSSAVGIAVYQHLPRPRAITTVLQTADGWFNTLRLARLADVGRIRTLIDGLCAEGVHVEREVPKAVLPGDRPAEFDLRVVAIGGEPAFTVVRCNRHPITNLHLGGWRGDLDEVRARCPDDVWAAAMADVRTVARDHGGLHLGCDVLLERGSTGHRVLEANAFGDLLPRLVDAQGRSVYAAEIAAVR
ncbi:MAG: STM4014 family protein [Myxococcota bacterium]